MPIGNEQLNVETWQLLTLINGWVNFGANYAPARYWKDPAGVVWVEGFVKSGTVGAIVTVLPVGYRPEYQQVFATAPNDNVAGRVLITTNGNLTLLNGATTGSSLIGVAFRAVG